VALHSPCPGARGRAMWSCPLRLAPVQPRVQRTRLRRTPAVALLGQGVLPAVLLAGDAAPLTPALGQSRSWLKSWFQQAGKWKMEKVLRRRLTPQETALLNATLRRLSKRAKHPITLEHLLQRWQDFVVQIERGYEDSIYEYTNDLSVRDLWEEILRGVPQGLRQELSEWIRPWDERFYKATRSVRRPILSAGRSSLHWWWFRVPKRVGEALGADLRFEGILKG